MGAKKGRATMQEAFMASLRQEIARQELSYYRVAKDSGISPAALSRFRHPGGTLSSANLVRLLSCLGIRLVNDRGVCLRAFATCED